MTWTLFLLPKSIHSFVHLIQELHRINWLFSLARRDCKKCWGLATDCCTSFHRHKKNKHFLEYVIQLGNIIKSVPWENVSAGAPFSLTQKGQTHPIWSSMNMYADESCTFLYFHTTPQTEKSSNYYYYFVMIPHK